MANGKHNKTIEYRDTSRDKNYTPGQLSLDISDGNAKKDLVEVRPRLCSPNESKNFWKAFEAFLDESGAFSRTWYLYRSIKDSPSEKELHERLNNRSITTHELDIVRDQLKRYDIMRKNHRCNTVEDFEVKLSNDRQRYKSALEHLLQFAAMAGVKPNIPDKYSNDEKVKNEALRIRNNILNAFVVLDDKIRGSARRQYYRDKYVNKALKEIKKFGYSDPISIGDMEKAFNKDVKWQDQFLARQERRRTKRTEENKA